jgi:hypothetical protein
MMFRKLRTAPAAAFALMSGFALAFHAFPAASQDQQQPPPADAAQPAADTADPAAQPATDGTSAAPAAEAPAEPAQGAAPAPSDGAAATAPSPDAGAAQPQGAAAEPAAPSAPADGGAATAINASQVQIGAAVFGSDGAKIGEINGVKSDDTGKVQQILVTDGVPASMNAKVFEISADKIASVADGVKLSLSSEEAKKLPIIDNSKG